MNVHRSQSRLWESHSTRAAGLGLLLAADLAPLDAGLREMREGFLLHDIGKVALPDAILTKTGPLTDAEVVVLRTHPRQGWLMLSELEFSVRTRDVVLLHHERWDGGGYPLGLHGEQIPLWARMLAVADAVDAMTSERPYRRARSLPDALAETRRHSGTQFDPACVAAFGALDPDAVGMLLEPSYASAALRSVASKSVREIGPTHGELVPASR